MGAFDNVFSNLASSLTHLVTSVVKTRAMKKDDLQQMLRNNIDGHSKMEYVLSLYDDKSMNNWYLQQVKPALKNNRSKAKDVYENYVRQLRGKAASVERSRALGSLRDANRECAKLLEDISKQIDKLVEMDSITVYDVRISQLSLLGLVRRSDVLLNFSMYLYSFLTRAISRTTEGIPRYREQYLMDKYEQVARLVCEICDRKGAYQFLKEVDNLRRNQNDFIVGATGRFDFHNFTSIRGFSINFLDNIISALSCLNIFGAAMDAWDNYQLAKYERNKETKEWLEQHVALLRMDLNDMDKTSPEYTRLTNIIKAYDDKIAEYDEEIIAFEQED